MAITKTHRKLEIRKFSHILNCEEVLGLHRDDLLPRETVKPPEEMRLYHAFLPSKRNTATFILRIHISLIIFAGVFIISRAII